MERTRRDDSGEVDASDEDDDFVVAECGGDIDRWCDDLLGD